VLRRALPLEDVLEHAKQPHAGEPLPDLLRELPVNRVDSAFAELDMAAERPVKGTWPGGLGHEQRGVPRALDDRHRLNHLGRHQPVLSHSGRAPEPAGRRLVAWILLASGWC
jgi:hypothetical protein